MSNIIKDQIKFMQAASQTTDVLNKNQISLYTSLISEEVNEFFDAETAAEDVKEAIDILVVTLGFLLSTGIDVQKAWDLVHANNMLKVKSKPEYDENGKVKKSEASITAKEEMMDNIIKLIDTVI